MARNSATLWKRSMRPGAALAAWVLAASLAQCLLGPDIGKPAREVRDRIEKQLRGLVEPTEEAQPQRSHEDEPLEPWELVGV